MALPTTPGEIARVPREEFLAERWRYEAGQHVTILGSTRSGKTHLGFQLLDHTATPRVPALNLVIKPKDATVARFTNSARFDLARSWPPPGGLLRRKPRGWTVWPRHTGDMEADDKTLYRVMASAITRSYKRGNVILFADEVVGLIEEVGHTMPPKTFPIKKMLMMCWSKGGALGLGVWAASQRPSGVPLLAYNGATHLFLAAERDKRNRQRFTEIAGQFDPDLIAEVTHKHLGAYEFLYLNSEGPYICIVQA